MHHSLFKRVCQIWRHFINTIFHLSFKKKSQSLNLSVLFISKKCVDCDYADLFKTVVNAFATDNEDFLHQEPEFRKQKILFDRKDANHVQLSVL